MSIPDMDDKVIATVNYLNIYQPQNIHNISIHNIDTNKKYFTSMQQN